MDDQLARLKENEERKQRPPRQAPTQRVCPACSYALRREMPILDGYIQVGSVCTCIRCGHEWNTWRKDSHRLAHIAACPGSVEHG